MIIRDYAHFSIVLRRARAHGEKAQALRGWMSDCCGQVNRAWHELSRRRQGSKAWTAARAEFLSINGLFERTALTAKRHEAIYRGRFAQCEAWAAEDKARQAA